MYLDFAQIGNGKSRRYVAYAIATIAFVAATLAKPQAVALPLVVGVIDVMLLKRDWKIVIRSLLLWFAWCIPVVLIGRASAKPANFRWIRRSAFRPIVTLDALAFYLGKIVWPAKLMTDYGRSPHWLIFLSRSDSGHWIVPIAAIIIALAVWRRRC